VAQRHPQAVVIGSDQVADLHGEPLGKPGTHERAVPTAAHARANRHLSNRAGRGVPETGFEHSDIAPCGWCSVT
jgi:septum formation protein